MARAVRKLPKGERVPVPRGMVFMNFHFAEVPTNMLTGDAVDPVAKIPEYKVSAVRVERV